MTTQRDLFKKFCQPGSEPIEVLQLRLHGSKHTLTTKQLGSLILLRASMTGTRQRWQEDYFDAVNMDRHCETSHRRVAQALRRLVDDGYLTLIYGKDLPATERKGESDYSVMGFNVLIGGGK
jgi:hypothetical protein